MDFSTLVTTAQLTGILDSITDVVPIVIPAVIAFIGFRKGYGFLKSQIKGL